MVSFVNDFQWGLNDLLDLLDFLASYDILNQGSPGLILLRPEWLKIMIIPLPYHSYTVILSLKMSQKLHQAKNATVLVGLCWVQELLPVGSWVKSRWYLTASKFLYHLGLHCSLHVDYTHTKYARSEGPLWIPTGREALFIAMHWFILYRLFHRCFVLLLSVRV